MAQVQKSVDFFSLEGRSEWARGCRGRRKARKGTEEQPRGLGGRQRKEAKAGSVWRQNCSAILAENEMPKVSKKFGVGLKNVASAQVALKGLESSGCRSQALCFPTREKHTGIIKKKKEEEREDTSREESRRHDREGPGESKHVLATRGASATFSKKKREKAGNFGEFW